MKTQNPWIGRARGSAGNMTSSKVYDKNVMRAKAFEVNNPNTAAQQSERNFFKQCQDAIAGVSEEQLRSLFPNMPKNKSRRNALMSQILKLFKIQNNQKILDISKLKSLGNGKKQQIPIIGPTDGTDELGLFPAVLEYLETIPYNYRIYVVILTTDTNGNVSILVQETPYVRDKIGDETFLYSLGFPEGDTSCGYITTASNENGVDALPIGIAKLCSPA